VDADSTSSWIPSSVRRVPLRFVLGKDFFPRRCDELGSDSATHRGNDEVAGPGWAVAGLW
jgi:hypothetical protein